MSLPNYLAKIKSAGIYRFVWDKSQISASEAETLRLVVGYSEKGPFNTPVYIDNVGDFKTIFGGINKKLEKRGVFFHRMALQALSAGPILALNVKKFKNETVGYLTAESAQKAFDEEQETEVKNVYNTSRFWTLDADSLPSNLKDGDKKYIFLASTDSVETSNSVFMRGYTPTGYDVTIKSWYANSSEEMPSYLNDYQDMLVSDFFAEIYVFKGEFTPAIAKSEELKKYFNVNGNNVTLKPYIKNAFGENIDTLEALSENVCSNFVQRYQGILLPYFKNINGAYISLDLLFNGDNGIHKMLMKLNSDILDDDPTQVAAISTRGYDLIEEADIKNAIVLATKEGEVTQSKISVFSNSNIVPKAAYATYNGSKWNFKDADYTNVPDLYIYSGDITAEENGKFKLPVQFKDLGLASGDRLLVQVDGGYKVTTISEIASTETETTLVVTEPNANPIQLTTVTGYEFESYDGKGKTLYGTGKVNVTKVEGDYTYVEVIENSADPKFEGNNYYVVGTEFEQDKMLKLYDEATGDEVSGILVKITNEITTTETLLVKLNHIITESIATMSPSYVKGYTKDVDSIKPASNKVSDKLAWQKNYILAAINTDSSIGYPGLVEALTNRVDIDYRYIVDTFESFVDSELKSSLALLAKKKDNCLLLTNFPAIQTFIKSDVSQFVDDNGVFQMKYVKEGANRQKSPGVLFSLPSEENGASWCSFNTPVVFTDGTVKTVVPAAALVSNNFMEKYTSRQPYYIVAGPTYGRLSYTGMVGPDYNFSRPDLDILEPMGVNATVYVPRKGTYINSNQTAKQSPVSALSKINVRELVIYLQDQIEELLQNYQWEFNTQALRDLIKAKADTICQNVQANGGIYAFYNQCDEGNNTDDVINSEMLVLSTSIEPGMGCGKMVQELTLYKKGGMTSVIS
jgi:hypothetical protein